MLQMSCPECHGTISSPLLAEISSIECRQCKAFVAVKEVFVSSKGFIVRRADLLNRIFRYRKLLGEVEKERSLLKDTGDTSSTLKSLDQFYSSLQELLAGARNSIRIRTDLPVEFEYGNCKGKGKLINISTNGALIKSDELEKKPRVNSVIKLTIPLIDSKNSIKVEGRLVWHEEKQDSEEREIIAGVKFINLDQKTMETFLSFVLNDLSGFGIDHPKVMKAGIETEIVPSHEDNSEANKVMEMETELEKLKQKYQEMSLENESLKSTLKGKI